MSDATRPGAAMLFAAGFGTRMGALTQDRPKPLIPVAGRPLLDHALEIARGADLSRIVVNTHYLGQQIAAHLKDSGVMLSHESPGILDTGGGLRAALPLLGDGPVYTLNTDAVWAGPNPLNLLARHWNPDRMDALLLLLPLPQAVGHSGPGDFTIDQDGRLGRGPGQVYSGAQIVKTEGLHMIERPVFSLNLLWDRILNSGRLFGLSYPGQWCDVGHPDGIAPAEAMLRHV